LVSPNLAQVYALELGFSDTNLEAVWPVSGVNAHVHRVVVDKSIPISILDPH
jgi:hypothetical protein